MLQSTSPSLSVVTSDAHPTTPPIFPCLAIVKMTARDQVTGWLADVAAAGDGSPSIDRDWTWEAVAQIVANTTSITEKEGTNGFVHWWVAKVVFHAGLSTNQWSIHVERFDSENFQAVLQAALSAAGEWRSFCRCWNAYLRNRDAYDDPYDAFDGWECPGNGMHTGDDLVAFWKDAVAWMTTVPRKGGVVTWEDLVPLVTTTDGAVDNAAALVVG